jgi:FO synthase
MIDSSSFWLDRNDAAAQLAEFEKIPLPELLTRAKALRAQSHGNLISFSPKVFIPLTRLCRDVCGYCTFAHTPRPGEPPYLLPDDVLRIAKAGAQSGCTEALFTLGELPEQRYETARQALAALGHTSTIGYLAAMAALVHRETGLLPHVNPGVMTTDDLAVLRQCSVSQGLMLESSSLRLCEKGGPHYGSPGKAPAVRISTIAAAGHLRVPFTTGILIGIGETRLERIESLLIIKALHQRYGHIQEVIVQNFRAKADTRMANAEEAGFDDLLWMAAVARIVLGTEMNIQVPPNLSYDRFPQLLDAGINDWGGVSPVTPDHVNPEAPWPTLDRLRAATSSAGCHLVARLPLYPSYVKDAPKWVDPALIPLVMRASDEDGWARADEWSPGLANAPLPQFSASISSDSFALDGILVRAQRGEMRTAAEIVRLLQARGSEIGAVIDAADALRSRVSGNIVRYVVNRNINYTNICEYRCTFCAFSKGKTSEFLRGKPYNVSLEEVARRASEAWHRGATEICMQGGIHPDFTGLTYLNLLRAVKDAVPEIHVHAFSPLEVTHGAATLGIPVDRFLGMLGEAGLGSLPGTAAEILDDQIRSVLCPDKLNTEQWLSVIEAAHRAGLRTTATIMFGHMERPPQLARHLLHIRNLQTRTGGFTEFVPLPFVHMEAPLYHRGRARKGPTFRETILMHAVARLALHPVITNVQASWVKLGTEGVAACLAAGVNDLGGTLMNESISRAAGTEHGQEKPPAEMDALIRSSGRIPQQRTTLYRPAPSDRQASSYQAPPLSPLAMGWVGSRARRKASVRLSEPMAHR